MEVNSIWNKIPLIFKRLPTPGILLVSGKDSRNKNVMTIGWIQFGIVWQEPVVSIMVRPSRYSYKLLQGHDEFTINIMAEQYNSSIDICGVKSGSFCDKFKEANLQIVDSLKVTTVSLKDADLVIECKKLYDNDLVPNNLNDLILARYYGNGDYHKIITAKILLIRSTKDKER